MSPEPSGPPEDALRALSDYIRDPTHAPAPAGIEERRLKVYRELFFNNVEGILAGNFPVIRKIFEGERWQVLIGDFYREHPARTPLFTELPREFLRYLDSRAEAGRDDPPWLRELAHYEWIELALQISEARVDDIVHDPGRDLLEGAPVVSPLAWPLAYTWPVQRIRPDYLPEQPPAAPTLLLVQRDPAGKVRFRELSPLAFRLLQRLDAEPALSGRAQLEALAVEATAPDVPVFVEQGVQMLEQLRREGVVLGARIV